MEDRWQLDSSAAWTLSLLRPTDTLWSCERAPRSSRCAEASGVRAAVRSAESQMAPSDKDHGAKC